MGPEVNLESGAREGNELTLSLNGAPIAISFISMADNRTPLPSSLLDEGGKPHTPAIRKTLAIVKLCCDRTYAVSMHSLSSIIKEI